MPHTDSDPDPKPDRGSRDDRAREFAELLDAGLVWMFNHHVLHPRGVALSLHLDDAGVAYGWSLLAAPDGRWSFPPEVDADCGRRAEATLAAAGATAPPRRPRTSDAQDAVLPPFSGDDAECAKCGHPGAVTRYRKPKQPHLANWGGKIAPRGALPERLERECLRCDYRWDEALAARTGTLPQGECAFCDILGGHAPGEIVAEWDDAVALVPLNPVTEGHLLVIPRAHVPAIGHHPSVTAAAARRVDELAAGLDACNVITSRGAAATQTVEHLHWHLVPRQAGDGLALPWEPPSPAAADPAESQPA